MGQEIDIQQLKDEVKNKVPWQVFAISMTLILAGMGWLMASAASTQSRADLTTDKVSNVEGDIKQIKNDIGWIKDKLK